MAIKKIENTEHCSWRQVYDGRELFKSDSLWIIQEKTPASSINGLQCTFMTPGDRKHLIS